MAKKMVAAAITGAVCSAIGIGIYTLIKKRVDLIVVNEDEDDDDDYDECDDDFWCDGECDECDYAEECECECDDDITEASPETVQELIEKMNSINETLNKLCEQQKKNADSASVASKKESDDSVSEDAEKKDDASKDA